MVTIAELVASTSSIIARTSIESLPELDMMNPIDDENHQSGDHPDTRSEPGRRGCREKRDAGALWTGRPSSVALRGGLHLAGTTCRLTPASSQSTPSWEIRHDATPSLGTRRGRGRETRRDGRRTTHLNRPERTANAVERGGRGVPAGSPSAHIRRIAEEACAERVVQGNFRAFTETLRTVDNLDP